MRRWAWLLVLVACSTEQIPAPDAGFRDAGPSEWTIRDAGPRDAGTRIRPDAGFDDPATLLLGEERIDGQRIYMQVRGTVTSTMPPVLFLATGPMVGFEYLPPLFDFLLGPGGAEAPNRLLVFADLRAVGRSGFGTTDTATVTFETHLLDVETVIDFVRERFGVTGPFDFVGHGYGSGLALNYDVLHPEDVSRIVAVGPYATNSTEYSDFAGELNARMTTPDRELLMQLTMWQTCLRDIQRCSLAIWNVWAPYTLCEENYDRYFTMTFEAADFRPIAFYVLPRLREAEYDWVPVFPNVSAPVTLFYGACEAMPFVTYENHMNYIPNIEGHILENSGHFPMVEEPERFQWLVKRALTY